MKCFGDLREKFLSDRRGAVAIITAIVMAPILFYCVGVPIDLARAIQLRSSLQNIADTAALAGSAELAQGGTASQACSIANQFVQAQAGQLSVPYSALTPSGTFATTNGETDTLTTISGNGTVSQTTSSSSASTGCQNIQPAVVSNSSSASGVTTTTASFTSPYQVAVGISTKIPTTFMSFAKANVPVSVSGTASGPTEFVKICMQNGGSISDDLSSFYYYYIDPSGNLDTDPNGDPLNKSNPLPALANNKLTDNIQNPNSYNKIVVPPTNPLGGEPADFVSTGCNSAATAAGILSYLVVVHLPPGWRLGYYYQNITGGKDVCYYADGQPYNSYGAALTGQTTYHWTYNDNDVRCLGNGSTAQASTGVAADGSGTTWNGSNNLTSFSKTAYGGTPLTINRFYTTDYPASLNSSTYSSTPISSSNGGAVGDFSATGQSAAIRRIIPGNPPNAVYFNSNANFSQHGLPTQTSGDNVVGQTSGDLVCLVNANTHTQDTSVITTYNSTGNYTTASGVFNDQQQNVVLQNSSQSSIYKCPTNVSGDPYNLNPSCADLNGATITGGWNDMGGYPADSVGYQDLVFSISCSSGTGVPQLDYDNVALTQ